MWVRLQPAGYPSSASLPLTEAGAAPDGENLKGSCIVKHYRVGIDYKSAKLTNWAAAAPGCFGERDGT